MKEAVRGAAALDLWTEGWAARGSVRGNLNGQHLSGRRGRLQQETLCFTPLPHQPTDFSCCCACVLGISQRPGLSSVHRYLAKAAGYSAISVPIHMMNQFFIRKVLPTFQTYCPVGEQFARTVAQFAHFRVQARKGGVLGWVLGVFGVRTYPRKGCVTAD